MEKIIKVTSKKIIMGGTVLVIFITIAITVLIYHFVPRNLYEEETQQNLRLQEENEKLIQEIILLQNKNFAHETPLEQSNLNETTLTGTGLKMNINPFILSDDDIINSISECVNVIGNTVPEDYSRTERTIYTKGVSQRLINTSGIEIRSFQIILETNNSGNVISSTISNAYLFVSDAQSLIIHFYNNLETDGFIFNNATDTSDIYKKNNIYVKIDKPVEELVKVGKIVPDNGRNTRVEENKKQYRVLITFTRR